MSDNIDSGTIAGFGDEWVRFDQSMLDQHELTALFEAYFAVFPWPALPPDAVGFDLGCGSGRWAKMVLPRVATLHCIDPSSAIDVARANLATFPNAVFHQAAAHQIPLADGSMDFGYSLGVLHHIPDTAQALRDCVRKLKPRAPFLVYLYYRFDNRPGWFVALWRISDAIRRRIAALPHPARYAVSQLIAAFVYFPLSRIAKLAALCGANVDNWPLSAYRNLSFYTQRTDALDRFGTQLEHRFTREEIAALMQDAGLSEIRFSDAEPYWCAVGLRA